LGQRIDFLSEDIIDLVKNHVLLSLYFAEEAICGILKYASLLNICVPCPWNFLQGRLQQMGNKFF